MIGSSKEQAPKVKKTRLLISEKQPKENSTVSRRPIIPSLSFLVALGALGTAGYTFFLNHQLQNKISYANTSLSTQVTQLEGEYKQINAQINRTENNHTTLQTELNHLNKEVQNNLNQKFYQNQDWLLLKARYYLELAQINAHWTTHSDSIIALMEQADQILKEINDPKILNIRQIIAQNTAQIKALPFVDQAGILSQLDTVQNSINDLNAPLPTTNTLGNTTSSTSKPSDGHLHLKDSINILEKLVVVRHHDDDIQPLMSPLLEALFKEKLSLNLQEAQWAILNNNPRIYQLVLKQAINTLKTHFNEHAQNTAALIKKLTELQQMKLSQELPVLDSALLMLNELIETKKMQMNQPLNREPQGNS